MERWHYPDISDLFDAANHFAGFTFFNFLVLSTLLSAQACSDSACRQALKKRTAAPLLAVGLTWGFVCELLQLFIPSRSFQFMDVAANTLPAVLVFYIFKMKMKRSYEKI
jgi:VanZ family protein